MRTLKPSSAPPRSSPGVEFRQLAAPYPFRLGRYFAYAGLLLAVTIVALSLLGISPALPLSGYNVQFLELAQMGPLCWVLLVLPQLARSEVVKGMGWLLLINAVPLAYGVFAYGAAPALRDFAGMYYMTMLIFGYALGRLAVISAGNLLVGLSVCGFLFIIGYFTGLGDGVIDYDLLEYNFRIPALVCSCSAALCLAGFGRLASWRRFVVLGGGLLYVLFVLQLRTRAAYLGLGAGALVVFGLAVTLYLREPRFLGRIVGRLLLGVAAVVLLSVIYAEWLSVLLANAKDRTDIVLSGKYYADNTVAFRLDAWHAAWGEFLASPYFGVGFGKYLLLDPWLRHEYALYPSHMIHNGVLQILYSGGLLTMGGMVFFWWRVRRALRASRAMRTVIPVLALLISLLFYTAFSAILFKSVEAILMWMIVGLAIGEAERLSLEPADMVGISPGGTRPRPLTPAK
jgi:O-antigen ligase